MHVLVVLFSALLVAACTWVSENSEGQKVKLSTVDRVSTCQNAGQVSASVAANIGFIPRNTNKIQKELLVLARNEAVKLNADTIVPIDNPVKGEQRFLAYRCLR